jgi:hypothetical protein
VGRLVPLAVLLLAVGPAALAQGGPVDRITVQVSWLDDNLLYVSSQISEEENPSASVADGPYVHGCASLPAGHNTSPHTLELNTSRHRPGRYLVIAYFTNGCLDYSDAGGDKPDPLDAPEAYPEGTPIEITATVGYWVGGSQVRTTDLRGTASVAWGPISEHWAVFGVLELEGPEGSEPVPGAGAGDPATPAAESGVADQEQAVDAVSGEWELGSSWLPQGWGLALVIVAVVFGVTSVSLLVDYLVRRRMGWGVREAAVDAVWAKRLEPSAGEEAGLLDILQEASVQLQGLPGPAQGPALAAVGGRVTRRQGGV